MFHYISFYYELNIILFNNCKKSNSQIFLCFKMIKARRTKNIIQWGYFYTNFFHQFFTPKFQLLFTPKFLLFLHQNFWFFTPILCTPKVLVFYTKIFVFLHQKILLFLTLILTPNFEIQKKILCKKIRVTKVHPHLVGQILYRSPKKRRL